jgi:hypothetical protein
LSILSSPTYGHDGRVEEKLENIGEEDGCRGENAEDLIGQKKTYFKI